MKVLLFDADGVLTLPEELFTIVYAKSRGLDIEPFEQFFQDEWNDIVTGKRDLKESIQENQDLWQWDGTPEELIEYWCKVEDVKNQALLDLIPKLKKLGYVCCLATDQEKYRGEYMRNVMFKGFFEHYFISSDLGVKKTDPRYFDLVLEKLSADMGDEELSPSDVIFFDDSQSKVDSALERGIDARLYTSIDQVRELLQNS